MMSGQGSEPGPGRSGLASACRGRRGSRLRRFGEGGPRQAEKADVMPGRAVAGGEVGQDFADDAAKLVAMTGAGGRYDNLLVHGVMIDDEMLVRRVGEHAGAERHGRSVALREIAVRKLAQQRFVGLIGLASQEVRSAVLAAMVIPSEFEAGNLVDRKAVMAAFLDVD